MPTQPRAPFSRAPYVLPQFLHFDFESFDGDSAGAHNVEITPLGGEIRPHIPQERQRVGLVPTSVPNLGSPTVTQENLPDRKPDALHALGLFWVMLSGEICSLKIRVSVARPSRAAVKDARRVSRQSLRSTDQDRLGLFRAPKDVGQRYKHKDCEYQK